MKTILVAVDGSPRAPGVIAFAADYAKSSGAGIVLLRVVTALGDIPSGALPISPAQILDVLLQRAQHELDELARTVPPEVPTKTRVETGTAWHTICDAGKSADAALIVIGSHGYTALDRMLGTTAARVVNHADRPVLVVR